jgi:hypothetical protein
VTSSSSSSSSTNSVLHAGLKQEMFSWNGAAVDDISTEAEELQLLEVVTRKRLATD